LRRLAILSEVGVTLTDSNTYIKDVKAKIEVFLKERDWEKFHTPKNLASSICIEAAELLEIFQWMNEEEEKKMNTKILQRVKEELADVTIYCLSMANNMNIDLTKAVLAKLSANENKYPVDKWKGKVNL
jgi:NTP pyrophosphatase (non-canonical NTP hydrolase)